MPEAQPPNRFSVYAADEGPRSVHETPHARSFEDAALEFTEVWHPPADGTEALTVIVTDHQSGREQCFRVDLDNGDARPC